jgi:hypothetical protein
MSIQNPVAAFPFISALKTPNLLMIIPISPDLA